MKQTAYIFLALALLVSLTSCASESSEAAEPPVSAASSEAAPAGQNQNDAEKDPILWSGETKTPAEAVAEMTWGVNLGEPFAGYSERRQGDPTGYNSGRGAGGEGVLFLFAGRRKRRSLPVVGGLLLYGGQFPILALRQA